MQTRRFPSFRVVPTAAIVISLWLAPVPARAQSTEPPRVAVAVGYEHLHHRDRDEDFGPGFFASIEGEYREWLTVAGEFSGTAPKPARFFGDPAAGGGGFVAGPRFTVPSAHAIVPFGQVFAGVWRSGDQRSGYPALAIQPGVGVDVAVHRHLKVRLEGHYCRLIGFNQATGATASVSALRAGLVIH